MSTSNRSWTCEPENKKFRNLSGAAIEQKSQCKYVAYEKDLIQNIRIRHGGHKSNSQSLGAKTPSPANLMTQDDEGKDSKYLTVDSKQKMG